MCFYFYRHEKWRFRFPKLVLDSARVFEVVFSAKHVKHDVYRRINVNLFKLWKVGKIKFENWKLLFPLLRLECFPFRRSAIEGDQLIYKQPFWFISPCGSLTIITPIDSDANKKTAKIIFQDRIIFFFRRHCFWNTHFLMPNLEAGERNCRKKMPVKLTSEW